MKSVLFVYCSPSFRLSHNLLFTISLGLENKSFFFGKFFPKNKSPLKEKKDRSQEKGSLKKEFREKDLFFFGKFFPGSKSSSKKKED